MRYVILGNGVCGMEAALALRGRDPEARITLVSAEHDHLFSRPAISSDHTAGCAVRSLQS
jgi:NADH dehydrogenase FAD-containing subunit